MSTMENTSIFTAASRTLPANFDIKYYLDILFSYPENEWFTPYNGDVSRECQGYTICDHLANANLIARCETPLWSDGSLRGERVQFKYSKTLKY